MSVLAPKPIQRADETPPLSSFSISEEAASLLKIHPKPLQKMARNGEIVRVQFGRGVAFPPGFEPKATDNVSCGGLSIWILRLDSLIYVCAFRFGFG
jgi:hypothetical protein